MRFTCSLSKSALISVLFLGACGLARCTEAEPALTDSEKKAIDASIVDFDSDDYQTREEAQKRTVALGLKAQPALEAKLDQLRKSSSASAEVIARLRAAIRGIEQTEISRIMDVLDLAVDQAPRMYIAPDPSTQQRLASESITFEWSDTPLNEVLSLISYHAHVPIVMDPRVDTENKAELPVSLRVADLKTNTALEWVLKLADLQSVVRGRVIVVTSSDRAARLRMQARTVSLQLAPGDKPWTMEETQALCEILKDWTLKRDGGSEASYTNDPPDYIEATEAGKILIHGEEDKLDTLETFAKTVALAIPPPSLAPWITELDERLSHRISVEFNETTLCDVVQALNQRLDGIITLHPKCLEGGLENVRVTLSAKDQPARETIVSICKICDVAAIPTHEKLALMRHSDIKLYPAPSVLNANSALKTGISESDLQTKLDALLENAHLVIRSKMLRGRWIAISDAWTAQRAANLISRSTDEKKIVEPIAPPWFFATLK